MTPKRALVQSRSFRILFQGTPRLTSWPPLQSLNLRWPGCHRFLQKKMKHMQRRQPATFLRCSVSNAGSFNSIMVLERLKTWKTQRTLHVNGLTGTCHYQGLEYTFRLPKEAAQNQTRNASARNADSALEKSWKRKHQQAKHFKTE